MKSDAVADAYFSIQHLTHGPVYFNIVTYCYTNQRHTDNYICIEFEILKQPKSLLKVQTYSADMRKTDIILKYFFYRFEKK